MHIPLIFTLLNPLTGLTESRVESLLLDAQRGDWPLLQWTYFFTEKRNATVRAVKRKLESALLGLDWDILTRDDIADADKPLAEAQDAALRAAYEKVCNLRAALVHLALADLRGHALCERIHAGSLPSDDPRYKPASWDVVELRCVEPWLWNSTGDVWRYNPEARAGQGQGQPIDVAQWIIRTVPDPADEIFLRVHIQGLLNEDDWAAHRDTFAVPPIFVIGPPNVSREQETGYQTTAERIVTDGRGYLPNGSEVKTITHDAAHEGFVAFAQYLQEQIVLTGTNGLLTMLTQSGSGTLAGGAHSDSWKEVASGIAMLVSEVMQAQFDGPLLREQFPGQPHHVYFQFSAIEEEDSAAHLTNAKMAADAGYRIAAEELSEKSGYTLTEVAMPLAKPTSLSQPPPSQTSPNPTPQPARETAAATEGNPNTNTEPPTASAAGASSADVPMPPAVAPVAEPPLLHPSAAGEASPHLVQAALSEYLELPAKVLAPAAALLNEIEAALLDPAKTDADILALLAKAHATMPALLPQLDIAALAAALTNASTPAAIQGLKDGLEAKAKKPTARKAPPTALEAPNSI